MAFLPAAVAQSYNPLNGLITPPGADQRSSGTPTAPGLGNPAQSGGGFTPATGAPPGIPSPTLGSSGSVPPFTPDYKSLIANDPGFLMAEADLGASGIANVADRNAAFQRNIIDYGQLPDLTKAAAALGLSPSDLQAALGGHTGQLAQENTQAGTSILARLNSMNSKTIQQIKNSLAARGMYRSGETGYQLGQQNQAYTNSQSDATKQLLDILSGAQSQYLSAEQQRQIALAQAASDAANRQQQANPGSPGYNYPTPVDYQQYWNELNGLSNMVQSGQAPASSLDQYVDPNSAAGRYAQSVAQQAADRQKNGQA